jgi:fructose-1-phosphate kinase PfkB-like protein
MPVHASLAFYPALISSHAGFSLLDTSGAALLTALEAKPDFVKINAAELQRSLSSKVDTPEGLISLMRTLQGKGAKSVGITQGGNFAYLLFEERVMRFVLPQVQVVSALGSGDSVNAGVIAALLKGHDLPSAFQFGLACGAANAETASPGAVSVERAIAICDQIEMSMI